MTKAVHQWADSLNRDDEKTAIAACAREGRLCEVGGGAGCLKPGAEVGGPSLRGRRITGWAWPRPHQ